MLFTTKKEVYFFRILLYLIIMITMSACITDGVPMKGTGVSGSAGLTEEQISFAKFKDIPIPEGSRMDANNTLIFGSKSSWFGRLSLVTDTSHAGAFDFFKFEMPNFNWQEITSVRAESSVLTYENNDRIATIQIVNNSIGNALCSITISPREKK